MLPLGYESKEIDFIAPFLRNSDVVVEIGAGIGAVTLTLSERTRRVYAYEMDAKNYRQLCDLLSNEGIDNVSLFNSGVLDRRGFVVYFRRKEFWNTSRIFGPIFGDFGTPRFARVEALTDVLAHHRPDVLVMDIEGDEYICLTSMERDFLPPRIFVEVHYSILGERAGKLFSHLLSLGYSRQKSIRKNFYVGLEFWERRY